MEGLRLARSTILAETGLPLTVLGARTRQPTPSVTVECLKIMFVTAGWSHLTTHSGGVDVKSGQIVAIPEAMACAGSPAQSVDTTTLYVDTGYLAQHLAWIPTAQPLARSLGLVPDIPSEIRVIDIGEGKMRTLMPVLTELTAMCTRQGREFETLARVAEVFGALSSMTSVPQGSNRSQTATALPRAEVAAAISLLEQYLDRTWSVQALAHEVALSESQLSRLFRRDTGVSPAAYLGMLRATRMAELLTTREPNVTDAGRSVGWPDPTLASRAFKRHYGISPREFAQRGFDPIRQNARTNTSEEERERTLRSDRTPGGQRSGVLAEEER